MKTINPVSDKVIKSYSKLNDDEIVEAINGGQIAFDDWKYTGFPQRSVLMKKAADVLKENSEKYARLITNEMGKTITESLAEIEKCAWVCEYYADNAEEFLKNKIVETDNSKSYVRFDPLGIIFAVMPWNFPFWQVFRFAAPTLMAGNVGLLKHSSNVQGCALAIDEVFKEAGFPANVFQSLLIDQKQVPDIISNKYIKAVTLTGSVGAGKSVAAIAGKYAKKSLLELGGSDPYIILKDADIDKASKLCVKSRMINAGQSCIAAKRFIVVEDVYESFVEKTVEYMKSYKMGDPLDKNTKLGPMASKRHRDIVHQQVVDSVKKGAKCLLGGEIPNMAGAYYPATILTNVWQDMPAYDDEIFGPVASIIKVKDADEAIKIANDSAFGLGGAIFSADIDYAEKLASRMDVGNMAINDFVKSDPRLPFGGVKDSGYGRELAEFGIYEFVNIKTIIVS
ncbi:NAD-dependent succinate-semialdehyde dehydrogenase [Rickettsiales bacterium]|nr:NAD-dependent succinate-semialdehyde dehydrogenase [Rickettsiales bacterium]